MTNDNDPLKPLGQVFGQVPAPDQWNEIVVRSDEASAACAHVGMHGRGWWMAAGVAALVALVGGIALIDGRDAGTAPASAVDTVPPPDPLMPCTSPAELEAIVMLLNDGAWLDYGQGDVGQLLLGDPHVVVAGDASSIVRAGGFRRLELTNLPTYIVGDGPVGAVSERSMWNGEDGEVGPDPLASPVRFENLRVVAALRSLSSAPVWSPDLGGLVVGCAGLDIPAIQTGLRAGMPR